ncbi:MAG: LamG-like jellyroll fold domain-containing protein, partial [Anaerohalosphaeraceae bacterium]
HLLSQCRFISNSAYRSGGGIYNKGSTPTISHCSFVHNTTVDYGYDGGAGVFNDESCPTITDCVFKENNTTYPENEGDWNADGGGITNYKNSNALIARCSFNRNSAGRGGGLCNHGSSPVVRDCTFTENRAGGVSGSGGGMASFAMDDYAVFPPKRIYAEPIVIHCTFERNYTVGSSGDTYGGGGMFGGYNTIGCTFNQNKSAVGGGVVYGGTITGCVFNQNEATGRGGGVSGSVDINQCIFYQNTAGAFGGALSNISWHIYSQTIADSTFINNHVTGSSDKGCGGAIYTHANSIIKNCQFWGNTVHGIQSAYGGGIYGYDSILSITNSLFAGNCVQSVNGYGGAIYDYENAGTSIIRNSSFLANSAMGTTNGFGGGIYNYASDDVITNCILWGNSASQGAQLFTKSFQISSGVYEGTSSVTYSDIEGGFVGDGNINLPPQVVRYPSAGDDGQWGTSDDDYGDLHLLPDSLCVDTGSNAAVPAEEQTGLMGTPRLADGDWDGTPVVDMGAYEYYLFGDLNFTTDVDMEDMNLLANHWMQTDCAGPDHCGQADINRNGTVDFDDFILLADQWLQSENITLPLPALPLPLAWWKMDETEGTVVSDSIGGYDGQTVNITDNPWITGARNNALQMDGVDDYVQMTGFKGITGTASRTCSAWIKANPGSTSETILSWGLAASGQKWMFRIHQTGVLSVGVWGSIQGTRNLYDGQWHHVAAVLVDDGSPSINEVKLYVDGVAEAGNTTSTQPINTAAEQDVQIGAFHDGTSQVNFFNGLLDEVRIYDTALADDEIVRLTME